MDALDLLEQQHRDVAALIEQIADETNPGLRTILVTRLARAIEAHSRIEERAFYPTLCARIGEHERIHEVLEDHAILRHLADNLLRTRATFVRFDARLRLLHDIFLRHASADEDWVFPKAKRNLSDEELDVLGAELARVHQILMTPPSHRMVHRRPAAPASAAKRRPQARRRSPLRSRADVSSR